MLTSAQVPTAVIQQHVKPMIGLGRLHKASTHSRVHSLQGPLTHSGDMNFMHDAWLATIMSREASICFNHSTWPCWHDLSTYLKYQ